MCTGINYRATLATRKLRIGFISIGFISRHLIKWLIWQRLISFLRQLAIPVSYNQLIKEIVAKRDKKKKYDHRWSIRNQTIAKIYLFSKILSLYPRTLWYRGLFFLSRLSRAREFLATTLAADSGRRDWRFTVRTRHAPLKMATIACLARRVSPCARHFRDVTRSYASWHVGCSPGRIQKGVGLLATASVTFLLAQQYLRPRVVHALRSRKVRTVRVQSDPRLPRGTVGAKLNDEPRRSRGPYASTCAWMSSMRNEVTRERSDAIHSSNAFRNRQRFLDRLTYFDISRLYKTTSRILSIARFYLLNSRHLRFS